MKVSRSELKQVIKECLIEILQEGTPQRQPRLMSQQFDRASAQQPRKTVTHDLVMREAIKREAGGNKLMEDIFSDTAKTTLPSMMKGEKSPPSAAGVAERIVEQHEPVEIFGEEAASKWASLAFMDGPASKIRE